jgi:hypothetical protein
LRITCTLLLIETPMGTPQMPAPILTPEAHQWMGYAHDLLTDLAYDAERECWTREDAEEVVLGLREALKAASQKVAA